MSDISQAEDFDPVYDDGQVEDAAPQEGTWEQTSLDVGDEPPTEPEYQYVEVDDPDSRHVKVTVDGEEITVPFSEVVNGYSRTADYTRKTQSLAEERQRLQQAEAVYDALRTDPQFAVQYLARQAGKSVEEYVGIQQQQQQQAQPDTFDEDDYSDPVERQLRQTQQQVQSLQQQIEQQQAQVQLQASVDALKQQHGANDDDVRQVVKTALDMNVGPEAFPMIYQSIAYQKSQAQSQAQEQAATQQQQQRQQRQAAAAAATGQVTQGRGATNVAPRDVADQNMSPREAIEAALADVNF